MSQKSVTKCKPFLVAMGYSKYKKASDGNLSLTLGPFVKCLEYATGVYPCVSLYRNILIYYVTLFILFLCFIYYLLFFIFIIFVFSYNYNQIKFLFIIYYFLFLVKYYYLLLFCLFSFLNLLLFLSNSEQAIFNLIY